MTPERMITYTVYSQGIEMLGTAEVELPSIEAMSDTISGAGIAGEVESPTLGHYGSSELTINWRTISQDFLSFTGGKAVELDLRAAQQIYDAGSNEKIAQPLRIAVRGFVKSSGLGNMGVSITTDSSTVIEITYISIYINGVKARELDKYNYIDYAAGKDWLSAVRTALGRI